MRDEDGVAEAGRRIIPQHATAVSRRSKLRCSQHLAIASRDWEMYREMGSEGEERTASYFYDRPRYL